MEIEFAGRKEIVDGDEVIVFDKPFAFEIDDIVVPGEKILTVDCGNLLAQMEEKGE